MQGNKWRKQVSEYDQEIPHTHHADQLMVKQPALSSPSILMQS